MAACDLCGKRCQPLQLEQLLASYRTATVEDVCSACATWATKRKADLLAEIGPRMRREIEEAAIAARGGSRPRASAWRRVCAWLARLVSA